MSLPTSDPRSFKGYRWRISYRTSSMGADGKPIDILHGFYVPVLQRAVHYDRVAGYFRSSSLAAASQGLSCFVGRSGKIRMIVGADLDPKDVAAILQGEEQRLTDQLNERLTPHGLWTPSTLMGIQLLSWLVTHGHLELRVAFRIHSQTGEPLSVDSTADGYVHEKWAIFTDGSNNRIYISGSLNESKTALALNAENIDVHCDWDNERDYQRVNEATTDFQALWEDKNPGVRVLPLPEAVRERLIRFSAGIYRPQEIDGSTEAPVVVPPPSIQERLRFAVIADGPRLPEGRYVGMETAPVTPWPHQDIVARRLIDNWPCSYLLCDEVGLGKTIESGLALRALVLSGAVRRVLITAPASLTRQWHREMERKFALPFQLLQRGSPVRHASLLPTPTETTGGSAFDPNLLIVSTGLLTREERQNELLQAAPFDICLLDEAHYARRQGGGGQHPLRMHPKYGRLFQTLKGALRGKSRSMWLASATPMQLHPVEVADLLSLTDRVGAFQFSPSLMNEYYGLLGRLLRSDSIDGHEWSFLRGVVLAVKQQDPMLWKYLENSAIDGTVRAVLRRWLDHNHPPTSSADRRATLRLLFTVAPLSRVMLRHTRRLLEIYRTEGQLRANLARRHILPIPAITFTEQERRIYDALEAYATELARLISANAPTRTVTSLGFYLSFLRLRFASSLFAIRETLRRRLERVQATLRQTLAPRDEERDDQVLEDDLEGGEDGDDLIETVLQDRQPADLEWESGVLESMLSDLADLSGPSSKMNQLMSVLQGRRKSDGRVEQTVVFTRFYDTLTDIVQRLLLVAPDLRIGTYSGRGGQWMKPGAGGLVGADREEIKHRFLRGEVDVLICTDAAAEGLNLQTANLLINFDLPWNPMKVEQRIGRIDRIGQKYDDIHVLNLCYPDSAEQIVYGRLLQRLASAQLIVGMQQLSLLPVEREEFQRLAEHRLTPEELERTALERARLEKDRIAAMEIPPEEMFKMYQRLHQETGSHPSPVRLQDIWYALNGSQHLKDRGCHVCDDAPEVLVLRNIPGVLDGTGLTINRETFERGVTSLEGKLHFATYGDPIFDAVLRLFCDSPWPGSIVRVESQPLPGNHRSLVGYAIACKEGGRNFTKKVFSYHEAEQCNPDEMCDADSWEVKSLQQHLDHLSAEENRRRQENREIERANGLAARSQELQELIVGKALLHEITLETEGLDLFMNTIRAAEQSLEQEDQRPLSGLKVELIQPLVGMAFPFNGMGGQETSIIASNLLLRPSIDAVCRVAHRMDVARSELTTSRVISRLDQEIRQKLAELSAFRLEGGRN